MALSQDSVTIDEATNCFHDEVLSSEHGVFNSSAGSVVNSDAFYVQLLNEDSNDSKTEPISEADQSHGIVKNVTNDELDINENCSSECDKKLEAPKENQCDNLSSDTTRENTLLVDVQTTENDSPFKEIMEQKVNEARQHPDSWTEDSSSSSSSSCSDIFEEMQNSITLKTTAIKTKGELDLKDLPPVEDLQISVEEKELIKIGHIHTIVDQQVTVLALKDQKTLDMDSVLFLSHDKPLGRVFDVFGKVSDPLYTIRFNSREDIIKKGINLNADVYYAPKKSDITSFVFVDALLRQKGSDASWKDNNEPPEEFLDYSDDEQERMVKQKRRGKNRPRQDGDVQFISSKKSTKDEIKPVPTLTSNRNVSSNYMEKEYEPQGQLLQPHKTRNPFRRSFYSDNTGRKIAVAKKSNNQSSAHTPFDKIPIWITSPPQFLQSTASTSQPNISNAVPPVSMQYQPHSALQHNSPQIPSPQPVSSYSALQPNRPSQLLLFPKQPFIPRQPQSCDNQPLIRQAQFKFPAQEHYINPPQPLVHQQVQQNLISQAPVFQNFNQPNTYRPVISVASMTPVVSFSTQTFNSHPSYSVTPTPFVPTNYQTFTSSPVPISGSNPPLHWQPQEQAKSPFTIVQSPPPAIQFNTQMPSFPSLPPVIRFNAAQNYPIPPPHPPSSQLSQQFLPNHSKF